LKSQKGTKQEISIDPKTEAVSKRKGYKITELLSVGAFGQVYKAVKIGTDQLYAVKVIDLDKVTQKFKEKFCRENWQLLYK
jgi:serine/threonine protein kinase